MKNGLKMYFSPGVRFETVPPAYYVLENDEKWVKRHSSRPRAMLDETIEFSDDNTGLEKIEFIVSFAFGHPYKFGIYKQGREYFARYIVFNEPGPHPDMVEEFGVEELRYEIKIPEEKTIKPINLLKKLIQVRRKIPADSFSSSNKLIGFDGTIYEFNFKSGSSRVHFKWWEILPEGYDLLQKIADSLSACLPKTICFEV